MRNIPRLVIAATQSGSGKTTIVTGLLAALSAKGLNVQPYKIGPDYIDPGYHMLASGHPGHNLDSWLVPEKCWRDIFARTAAGVDLAIIEGVMGLYDGGRQGISSTAEIAKLLAAPVLLVIDAKSMGASAAAIALGFRQYDPAVRLAGVILNRLGSETHEQMIRTAMQEISLPVYGALRRDDSLKLPERHLGLLPTTENEDNDIIKKIGTAVGSQLDLTKLTALAESAPPLDMAMPSPSGGTGVVRIGVAKDEAFSFYYPESLQVLIEQGAEIIYFSPLHDESLPDVQGIILGGGFPEMFADKLQANGSMRISLRQAAADGMPIYAECGGYMYLKEKLVDFSGQEYSMAAIIPGTAVMANKLQMVGYVTAELTYDSVLGKAGQSFRGHEFHFSMEQEASALPSPAFKFTRLRNGATYLAGYARKNVLGSYLHLHFAGCPEAAKFFVGQCLEYGKQRGV